MAKKKKKNKDTNLMELSKLLTLLYMRDIINLEIKELRYKFIKRVYGNEEKTTKKED